MAADTCRLCLRPIDKAKSSNLLTETTKLAMLKEFLPDMNLDISENTEVCNNCMGELETSYNYKNGVVANEANIQAKLKGKKQKKIDLKLMLDGVAKKELKKGDHICRTCLSICKSPSISLFDSPSNMMPYSFVKEMCEAVFELEFIASAKPVLCDDCWETLQTVYNFRKSCLRIDQRLRTYVASKNVKKLSIDEFKKFAEENPVKEEDEDSSDEEINGYIKDEPIDEEELKIDPEEASCSSSSVKVKDETEVKSESELNSDDEDMEDEPDLLDPKALKSEASEPDGEDCKMEIGDVKVDTEGEGAAGTSGESSTNNYQCNVQRRKDSLNIYIQTHEAVEQIFSCIQCSFKTTLKNDFQKHLLIHQSGHIEQMFSCDHCLYQTRRKGNLRYHMLVHRVDDEIHMFLCPQCSFKTKHKSNLRRHMLVHQSEMFLCTQCSFKTKYKEFLNEHMQIHPNDNVRHTLSSSECSYKTRRKEVLQKHMNIHNMRIRQIDDIKHIFSCTQCSYITIRKGDLQKHQIIHQAGDIVSMFSCAKCTFKTRRKLSLRRHMLVHQSDDIGMFLCAKCSYKTKQKGNLLRHMLVHQSDDVVPMFICTECPFKTKHKIALNKHMLSHKTDDDIRMFSCTQCSFNTNHKGRLKMHQLIHYGEDT